MAIKEFKSIVDTKGYKLDDKDRKIFERDMQKTLFGTSNTTWNIYGNSDMIEFVLYDSNENKLPQGENGDFVRYIHLDDVNINKYFLIKPADDSIFGYVQTSPEYLVDTELLIKEAGYSNGIFKTQITLLNRRAGSEKITYDRMWIHEIAPSRTEIRVLPVNDKDDNILPDLQERYNIFVNGGQFRDDTIMYVQQFVESIDIQKVLEAMLKYKGPVLLGRNYVNLIKTEFKIDDFEKFLLTVKEKLVESMRYFVENRDYNINSLTYGLPLSSRPPLSLSKDEICTVTSRVLADTIDHELPRRNILENSTLSMEDQITFDKLQDLYTTVTSDNIYESTLPGSPLAPVRGCMDPNALNFNPSAKIDDGSCIYSNNPDDNVDVVTELKRETFYVWSDYGKFRYTDANNVTQTWLGAEYEFITIVYYSVFDVVGDIRTYPKPKIITDDPIFDDTVPLLTCTDPKAVNYGQIGKCEYLTDKIITDCTEVTYNGITGTTWDSNLNVYTFQPCSPI